MVFHVKQEKFEGPLEALVQFIEKEKLAISEISLAKVADEYCAYVAALPGIDPEELAEFLVIAAQLMLIKSRSLLPSLQLSEEEEETVGELEARIREYQKYRELAKSLQALQRYGKKIATREAYMSLAPIFYPPPRLMASVLETAFRTLLSSVPRVEKLAEEKIKRIISLEEKIAHVRAFIVDRMERGFSELVSGAKEKVDVIVSFLAILELARQKFVDLHQEGTFTDIIIKKLP